MYPLRLRKFKKQNKTWIETKLEIKKIRSMNYIIT